MQELEKSQLSKIEMEIEFYKGQAVQSIFEIGERLIEAKKLVRHGEWENWLKKKVDFSSQQANRFMRVRKEFSNPSTLRDLSQSKIFAMLTIPKEEREEFIENNPVKEMTTKELRQAIKDRKEEEEKRKQLEEEVNQYKNQQEMLLEENKLLKDRGPKIIEKEKEVVPDDLKEKLLDLEENKRELEKLKEAGMGIEQYKQQKNEIDKELRERRKEYESLMDTMRRLEESYDKKNKRLTVQANLLNKIRMAVKPLKESSVEIERLFDATGELDTISANEVASELDAVHNILEMIDSKLNTIDVEEIYYERKE